VDKKKPIEFRQTTLNLISTAQEMAGGEAQVERRDAIQGVHLGTSAFTAAGWEGSFYPTGMKPRDFLSYYATKFNSVEVDSTFYRTPTYSTVNGWYERTPPDFVFAAKVPKVITHEKILEGCGAEMDEFIGVMDALDNKLGPLLLQFPYFNKSVFASSKDFVARLRFFLKSLGGSTVRYAVEIRNKDWLDERFADLLREHQVSLTLIDQAWMPRPQEIFEKFDPITADFAYVRLLGDRKGIERVTRTWDKTIVDRTSEVQEWVKYCRQIVKHGVKLYVYTNNHYAGHAPATVRQFVELWSASPLT
jgi:uncharacterized protein YecE (DUF72 family)